MAYPYQITSREAYDEVYAQSIQTPDTFWAGVAQHFTWRKRWNEVLSWNFEAPLVSWFAGAQLNISENCLDRHLESAGATPAILWEPNSPDETTRMLTYRELHQRVCALAAALRAQGVGKGNRVCIYMGMIPELAIAMLACARIGAIHSVIFGGFSAQSIRDRVQDAGAICIITADFARRGAKDIPLKSVVDEAANDCLSIQRIIVYQHTGGAINMQQGRDVYWGDILNDGVGGAAEVMGAEDPLFILYTSGSTGKPKGVVHTAAGYMIYTAYTFVNVFQYTPGDVFFCTADAGWITGHSYIVYGPLLAGATVLMFEGIPTYPDAGRLWDIIAKHKVATLYTAPTAIRSLMSYGLKPLLGKDLSSLKVLGSVGEPINEEAWHWMDKHIGGGRCPIVDTWFQTETACILISNLAGVTPAKPAHATLPLPGIQLVLMDEKGTPLEGNNVSGNLCIAAPWPSVIRTTWGDHERCRQTYFSAYPGYYFTGDGALRDESGNYRITGRVDDVLNVSGHRIGTAEVENAINEDAGVVESAVVGFPHEIKGQGIYAFVTMEGGWQGNEEEMRKAIHAKTSSMIGAFAKPDKIQFVSGLPKTRSGKIMRRILRKIAEGEMNALGDTSTLLDPSVVEEISRGRL